jgi:hypothetical protein
MSRAGAAARLQVSERHVNRLMRKHGVARPASMTANERAQSALAVAVRRQIRWRNAERVAEGAISLELAAAKAGCSPRTMYRWLAKVKKSSKKRKK